jgi:hypothetical protein
MIRLAVEGRLATLEPGNESELLEWSLTGQQQTLEEHDLSENITYIFIVTQEQT